MILIYRTGSSTLSGQMNEIKFTFDVTQTLLFWNPVTCWIRPTGRILIISIIGSQEFTTKKFQKLFHFFFLFFQLTLLWSLSAPTCKSTDVICSHDGGGASGLVRFFKRCMTEFSSYKTSQHKPKGIWVLGAATADHRQIQREGFENMADAETRRERSIHLTVGYHLRPLRKFICSWRRHLKVERANWGMMSLKCYQLTWKQTTAGMCVMCLGFSARLDSYE